MTTLLNAPDILLHEPAEVYHAQAGEFLSSHLLADFRKCPLLYHRKRCGLVPDEDRPAYLLGRAAHTVSAEEFESDGEYLQETGRPDRSQDRETG